MRWCLRSLEYFCIILYFPFITRTRGPSIAFLLRAHEKKVIVRPSQASALWLLYALSTRPVPIVLDRHLFSNSFEVLATLSNLCLSEQFLSKIQENISRPKKSLTFS